jgi:hypothetical protein
MAREKTVKALKKSGVKSGVKKHSARPLYQRPSTDEFYHKLRKVYDGFMEDKEKSFKGSERWEYLRKGLLDAAAYGLKYFAVKTTEREFGEGKIYAEWEIDSFVHEYGLLYCFYENRWRIYWF